MNSGKYYEHEAFLSLLLSRFVFPCNISAPIFSILVNLARSMRLTLARVGFHGFSLLMWINNSPRFLFYLNFFGGLI